MCEGTSGRPATVEHAQQHAMLARHVWLNTAEDSQADTVKGRRMTLQRSLCSGRLSHSSSSEAQRRVATVELTLTCLTATPSAKASTRDSVILLPCFRDMAMALAPHGSTPNTWQQGQGHTSTSDSYAIQHTSRGTQRHIKVSKPTGTSPAHRPTLEALSGCWTNTSFG
jgi:hypothetical protein